MKPNATKLSRCSLPECRPSPDTRTSQTVFLPPWQTPCVVELAPSRERMPPNLSVRRFSAVTSRWGARGRPPPRVFHASLHEHASASALCRASLYSTVETKSLKLQLCRKWGLWAMGCEACRPWSGDAIPFCPSDPASDLLPGLVRGSPSWRHPQPPASRGQGSQPLGESASEFNPAGPWRLLQGWGRTIPGKVRFGGKRSPFFWSYWPPSCLEGAHPLLNARKNMGKSREKPQKASVLMAWVRP